MIFNDSKFNSHWAIRTLNELGTFKRGKSKHRPRNDPALFYNGKYPFVQTGEIKSANLYIRNHSAEYSEFGLKQSELWPENTLCITIAANIAESGAKIKLFDELSQYVSDPSKRDEFCRAIINKMLDFSFERIFDQKFDFFAAIFEYLIQDYNKDGGGKYAEYYTPRAVAKIMASILVDKPVSNVTCYDPSAGSGSLLMSLAHAIGEDKCTIFSQDISQKSSTMLRLNLVLNNLVHSIQNIIQGNTLDSPYHRENNDLMKFDYIVSNPPFNLDFSDFRDKLDTKESKPRFFAGIPKIPAKKKNGMAIYILFLQHIIYSLSKTGKAAVVVPTGFLTWQDRIAKSIRQKLVEDKMPTILSWYGFSGILNCKLVK